MRSVLICDRDQLRCKAWARVCAKVAPDCQIFTIYEITPSEQPDEPVRGRTKVYNRSADTFGLATLPTTCTLALRHYRDQNIVISPAPRVEIWYGGNGQEMHHGKAWNIVASLPSANTVKNLADDEVAELITWAIAEPLEPWIVPGLLRPPIAGDEIHGLHILCQGYLAAWANEELPPHLSSGEFNRALEESGWPAFHRDHPLHPALTSLRAQSTKVELRDRVSSPSWWSIFDRPQTISVRVREEWGKTSVVAIEPVEQLLDYMGEDAPIPPEVVAKAYLALADRLRA